MAKKTKPKVWSRSRLSNLYLHVPTGTYYARAKVAGVDRWATLETGVFSVAEQRIGKKVAELRRGQAGLRSLARGIATVGQAADAYRASVDLNVHIKASSIAYRKQTIDALLKSWPGLSDRKLADVTRRDCEHWAAGYAKRVHGSRYNNTLDTLRHIFELGVDRGLIHSNAAAAVGKVKVTPKKLQLPTREQFTELLKAVEASGAWCKQECADLIRFLAFSGCRITEASHVQWKHIDGKTGTITIEGDPETGTKNRERRLIPIIEPMRELLERLADREKNPRNAARKGYVLHVVECREALETACAKLKIPKLTHHDLRHLFATRCIESSVDIPTVSRWLGHKDGGALAMKTYGHLRDEHSQQMAAKVSF
jgi:integrase